MMLQFLGDKMRHIIYFSQKARTSGNFPDNDLMKAGRMDIVCNVIIQTLFLSNKIRENIHLHLIFNGQPNPPQHLEFISNQLNKEIISKKDIAGLIKRMLYKSTPDRKTQPFPGCYVEKKSLKKLLDELEGRGKTIYILDIKGNNIRKLEDNDLSDSAFLIGDHEGLPKKELKPYPKISLGNQTYFASQTAIIINHELDMRNL